MPTKSRPQEAPSPHEQRLLNTIDFRAVGCQASLGLYADEGRAAMRHLAEAQALIEAAEQCLSRFRPDSELTWLNSRPGQPVPVSPLLWQATQRALAAASQTNGLFDPTVIDALEVAGYDRSFEHLTGSLAAGGPLPARTAGWRDIQLAPRTRAVALPVGVRLDFGSIGKALFAEQVADTLAPHGACIVDLGGDVVARGQPPGTSGWLVGVADPLDPERDLAWLMLRDRSAVTSGIDYRRWQRGGLTQHHLIDPRTGRPAETDLLSATVVARDAVAGNVHALVTMVLGSVDGMQYLLRQEGIAGLLVRQDGAVLATPALETYIHKWIAPDRRCSSAARS